MALMTSPVAGRVGGSQERAPFLLIRLRAGFTRQHAEIKADVLGVVGDLARVNASMLMRLSPSWRWKRRRKKGRVRSKIARRRLILSRRIVGRLRACRRRAGRLHGHKLVRLQTVEDAQRILRVAADIQVIDVNMLNDVMRIDDIGCAQCDAFRRANAEAVDQRTGRVGELPGRMIVEIRMVAAPRQLAELIVRAAAHHDRVAIVELSGEAAELSDLGRAHKGEILRVEVDDFPLSREKLS